MSSQLAKLYPQRVPYVTISQHFRLFLDKVLTEKCFNVENWDDLITVGEIPDAGNFKLPQVLGEVTVTTPAEVSIASIKAESINMMGQSEQVGGATKAREDLSEAEDLTPSAKVVTPAPVKSKTKKAMKADAVTGEEEIDK